VGSLPAILFTSVSVCAMGVEVGIGAGSSLVVGSVICSLF